MRKLLSITMLVAFVLIVSDPAALWGARKQEDAAATPEGSTEGPQAYLSETAWDFGKIPKNSVVSHGFWIKNVGTDTLKIMAVRPG